MAAPRPRREVPLDSREEGVRGFPDFTYCCIIFQIPLASVKLPKALVTIECYHVVSLTTLLWMYNVGDCKKEKGSMLGQGEAEKLAEDF